MFVKFYKLRYKNILSTGNLFTEIDLQKNPHTLIVGENGAGKSTMIEALTFALFNKSYRGLNKPELVNSITRKHLVCECEFAIGGEVYKVSRGINPNFFEIYKNGDMIDQTAAIRDYQQYFEKHILRVNYKTFCQCVVLGTSSYIPFMKLPAQGRREVVEDILDLQIFSIMNSLLKSKIQNNDLLIVENDTKREMLYKQIRFLEQQRDNVKKQKEEEIETLQNEILSHNEIIKKLNHKNEILIDQLNDEENVRKSYEEMNNYLYIFRDKQNKLFKEVAFYEETDTCPTCSQHINEKFKEDSIAQKKEDIKEYENGISKASVSLDILTKRISEIDGCKEVVANNKLEMVRSNSTINLLSGKIKSLKEEIKNSEVSGDYFTELSKLEIELANIEQILYNLFENRKNFDIAIFLLKDTGIKAKIISQYIPVINKLINKYLSLLDFYVNFELDEHFNETILSRYRDSFSYASFSEGERYRINLAVLFTWRAIADLRGSFATNILFLDEVMDSSLDATGTEQFLNIVQSFNDKSNVFIISHKVDQLYDKFANIVKFEKMNNFSSMVEL